MSSDFTIGLVTGALATVLGFVLTMAWELWKERRQETSRVKAVCRALLYELDENQEILAKNRSLLESEQVLLSSGSFLLGTIMPFKHEMWFILKSNVPTSFLDKQTTLPAIRDAALAALHVNEGAASRQTYKDISGAMSNFAKMLSQRNAGLLDEFGHYGAAIAAARGEIQNVLDAI